MAYETIYQFTEWCYNRIVETYRAGKYEASRAYEDTLRQHLALNLKAGKFVDQRRQARNLLQKIDRATKTGNKRRLPYTGEKYEEQKRIEIEESEKALRKVGMPEETINYLIKLKKENYGDQFF